MINEILKRDKSTAPFDPEKIYHAVVRCLTNGKGLEHLGYTPEVSGSVAHEITQRVINILNGSAKTATVEQVQDLVEQQLMAAGHYDAARAYILYRNQRAQFRQYCPMLDPEDLERLRVDRNYFGNSDLRYFQFADKYSRWIKEKNRRETWPETVQRALNFIKQEIGEERLTPAEWLELETALFQMDSLCSMRLLQMAGPAATRCNSTIFNCLRRDTPFVTDKGVRTFKDFEDGDEVTVIAHTGQWRKATVRCYGSDKLLPIELHRGRSCVTVYATSNHRWLLKDGTETTTLKVGDVLAKAPMPFSGWRYEDSDPLERLYWAYGYTYGDGTKLRGRDGHYKYSMVRLCNADALRFASRFEELGFKSSACASLSGDLMVYTGRYLKSLPDISQDGPDLVRAFVRGYLDADGAKQNCASNRSEFKSIQATGDESIDFIRQVFPAVGVYITREEDLTGQTTNYGTREHTVRFGLVTDMGVASNSYYSVARIGWDEALIEDVWCLEVEEDRSFVLPGGVLTGNCSFAPIKDLRCFAEILYVLMQGCGAGFSVESEFVEDLPKVKKQKGGEPYSYVIEDSDIGWCDAFLFGLEKWFNGEDVIFDDSRVRPAGAILETKGGRASGPEPLMELLQFTRQIVLSRQGKRLRPIHCLDIVCKEGDIVQVGGVRRAALICLFDEDDVEVRRAKHGAFWQTHQYRGRSNNSIAFWEKPSEEGFLASCWLPLMEGKTGEPGIFNREGILRKMPKRRSKMLTTALKWIGVNPCQPGFATVLTPNGIRHLSEINVGDTIWTESGWATVAKKWATGTKPVYRYRTSAGSFVGTENHRVVSHGEKIEVSLAESIDTLVGQSPEAPCYYFDSQAVMDGLVIGDGTVHEASNDLVYLNVGLLDGDSLNDPDIGALFIKHRPGLKATTWEVETTIQPHEVPKTYERQIPERYLKGDVTQVCSFLRGLYSANGSVCGYRVTLKASSREIIDQVQLMLSSLGIRSYVTINRPHTVQFSNGEYECRESYDLNISTDRRLFRDLIGFIQRYKQEKLESLCTSIGGSQFAHSRPKLTYGIQSIEYLGDFEVFDITVENAPHTYWTGGLNVSNCGEIALRMFGFCNLSIAVARPEDTVEDLRHKVRIAAIFGTLQSTMTRYRYLREEWKRNAEEERLLGVDINGWQDCELLRYGAEGRCELMEELRELAVRTNREWAERLGINPSAAVSCVKPSGNSSTLLACSSGLHPREGRYYIRRVRAGRHNPITKFLQECGVPWAPEVGQDAETHTTVVFDFLEKAPEGALTYDDLNAENQFYNWLEIRRHWTEHNPSCTIRVKDGEWLNLGALVYGHWDDVGGLSFMNRSDHIYQLAPYEQLTQEEYERRLAAFPPIPWEKLPYYEDGDQTGARTEFACTADGCSL